MKDHSPTRPVPAGAEPGPQEQCRSGNKPTATVPGVSLSPRRRRLRLTIIMLSIVALLGIGLGLFWAERTRPDPYRPGEAMAGITSELARRLPPGAPMPRFVDVTVESGLEGFRTFAGDRTSQLPEDMGPGVAWGDFNNNGFDDLFLVSAGGALGLPDSDLEESMLLENLGDGTFRRVVGFPELRIRGMGAAWGDYDNDGFLDLVVAGYGTLQLFRNEGGTGQFTRVATFPDIDAYWAGVSWGDYDRDGWLDLYVCGYVRYEEDSIDGNRISMQLGTVVPFTLNPASYPAQENLLLRNLGNGTFTNVAVALGVSNPEGRSLAALWHDFDDDGWPDLYVANDVSDNVFYRNTGNGFEDLSHSAHVADYRSAMGLAAGDFDRDGDDDLFIGHWVGQENALFENFLADLRLASGSAGRTNGHSESRRAASPLRFMDVADQKGLGQVALPYVSWGAEFADFDGDGWLDLVVANGNTLEVLESNPRQLRPQETFLFWNDHGRHFHNLAPLSPVLSERHVARGLALADYDNDGAVDILLSFLGEGVQLLRNQMQTGNWAKIRLRNRTPACEPIGFADGARVIAWLGDIPLRRTVSSASYLSQSSRTLHFGLGSAQQIDRLEIHWASGSTDLHSALAAQAMYEMREGDPTPTRWKSTGTQHSVTPAPPALTGARTGEPLDERGRVVEFWKRQRAAMDAMMIDGEVVRAIGLFESALELNPQHQDSRYYLAHCLMDQGDVSGALDQLEELTRINPRSHRGFQQWGVLRAISATTADHLAAAERSLQQAHAINPEETGALLLLGEVALLRGDRARARPLFAAVCGANARAVGGWFLQGYLAWSQGDESQAVRLLEQAREALGPEWHPKGTTAEGDVKEKQHVETSPLSGYWEKWDGIIEPARAFAPLHQRLKAFAHLREAETD
jgi:enediyne biosynthesis protein E4